jgi:hypothetical protein
LRHYYAIIATKWRLDLEANGLGEEEKLWNVQKLFGSSKTILDGDPSVSLTDVFSRARETFDSMMRDADTHGEDSRHLYLERGFYGWTTS